MAACIVKCKSVSISRDSSTMKVKLSTIVLVAITAVVITSYLIYLQPHTHIIPSPIIVPLAGEESQELPKLSGKDHTPPPSTKLYEYTGDIYFDWTRSSYTFNYVGYKSLESALVAYPDAKVESILVGPEAANYYKVGELMR